MEKVCFLVCQYGKEVNGGAEYHCKMLAERLTPNYHVDVLTTKIINYNTYEPYYTQSEEIINGVNVLRFDCQPFDRETHDYWRKKSKLSRKIRRNLYRLGLSNSIANLFPIWHLGVKQEIEVLKSQGFYSEKMLDYLQENKDQYKAIILMSYHNPHTIFGAKIAPEKTILIPTLHEESEAFRSIQSHVFTNVGHIAFNTIEETTLAKQLFGDKISPNSVIAVGVETEFDTHKADQEVKAKFDLPAHYLHYFGRVCRSKLDQLIPWFIAYKQKHPSDLKLVLTGRVFEEKITHPDLIYTGFVSDEEKIALIKNATLVVNPSKSESLSLLLLEAMDLGKTVIVNGKSAVMKGHAIRSGFAAEYYTNKDNFQQIIHKYMMNPALLEKNNVKAKQYVQQHYNWKLIMDRVNHLINQFG